ncbi:hypothetical protein OIU78_029940 [Salix suchowensis]|nr:hypothetical protein OIU78_029940 [Salix suchowensis]
MKKRRKRKRERFDGCGPDMEPFSLLFFFLTRENK